MDEVYRHLRKLYGQFALNTSTSIENEVLVHLVSIRALVAGKAVEAEGKGTGNVTNVVKQVIAQLQLESLKVMSSKEVTGIPGVIKPIIRKSDSLSSKEVITETFDFDDDSCDDYCPECGELVEYCTCDDDLDEESDEECNEDDFCTDNFLFNPYFNNCEDSPLEKGKEITPGVKFVGTEEDIEKANEIVPGIRFVGAADSYTTEEQKEEKGLEVPPGFKLVPLTEEELKEETQKLCCTVASKKGYTFCPDCGTKLF